MSGRAKIAVEANAMTAKQIEAAAIKLPKRDRERIANRLRESLQTDGKKEILEAWLEEVERRERDLAEGREEEIPYEQVKAKIRASLRR
jgi:putative addiction module component (TIGR02574 family)